MLIHPSFIPRITQHVHFPSRALTAGAAITAAPERHSPRRNRAAQGAINRTLRAAALDLHGLAGLIDGNAAPRDHHPLDDADWRDKVVYASVHASLLNEWERGFIDNMLGWDGSPTSKQMDRIAIIYNKVKAKTGS